MLIYFDTAIVIYHLEASERFQELVHSKMAEMSRRGDRIAIGDMVRLEYSVQPLRLGDHVRLDAFERFASDPDVEYVSISSAILLRAAELRAKYRFKLADSLQLSSAIEGGCGRFLTNDTRLATCTEIAVEVLGLNSIHSLVKPHVSRSTATMSKKPLRVGMIGYGFMGRAHSNAYKQVGQFFPSGHDVVLQAACARNEAEIKKFAEQWGYASVETDWKKLLARKDIDVVDICTPNNLHKEIALAAAAAGKMILCEKPLAMNSAEGMEMVAAVEKAGVPNMVWYNYRRIPAVTLAKKLIEEGRLGRIFHYRAKFLQDWTIKADLPQGGQGLWRLDVAAAGSGVSGDLLAHCIDTAVWLNGGMESVCCMTETFVKERMHNLTGKVEKVGIDDACIFMGKFANGSLANFESTRYARGHKAAYTFEINGENMSIAWDLHDLQRLQIFDYKDEGKIRGWKSIHVTDNSPDHPYMANWWVPGLSIGYDASFTHQVADFIQGLESGKPQGPTFRDALETQRILDAILDSAKSMKWVDVAK